MKENDKVTVKAEENILVYLVYLIGSELPIAAFWDIDLAYQFCHMFTDVAMDKEIRTANIWKVTGPLFRDRTQFLMTITIKNPEDEGLT